MRTQEFVLALAGLLMGVSLVLGSGTEDLAVAAARNAEEESTGEAAITQFCMGDNHNRIYKLSWIAHTLVIGQLWARPVNGFVLGTLRQSSTGQSAIKMSFFDPVVGPPSWTCQGTGGPTLGYYNGTCKSGGLTVGWGTYYIPTCPF